jgi:hypothetical protein
MVIKNLFTLTFLQICKAILIPFRPYEGMKGGLTVEIGKFEEWSYIKPGRSGP